MRLILGKITLVTLILVASLNASTSEQGELVRAVAHLVNSTPIYRATATILVTDKFFRQDYLNSEQNVNPTKADFAYHVAVAKSDAVVKGVEQRIEGELRERLMAAVPVSADFDTPRTIYEVLRSGVKVSADVEMLTIRISYEHSDPIIAATVANTFAKESIDYQLKLSIDTLMKRAEDLRIRVESMGKSLEEFSKQDLSNDRIKIAYASDKKHYENLAEQLRFTMTQVNLANPSAFILDAAYPSLRSVRRGKVQSF